MGNLYLLHWKTISFFATYSWEYIQIILLFRDKNRFYLSHSLTGMEKSYNEWQKNLKMWDQVT